MLGKGAVHSLFRAEPAQSLRTLSAFEMARTRTTASNLAAACYLDPLDDRFICFLLGHYLFLVQATHWRRKSEDYNKNFPQVKRLAGFFLDIGK